MPSIASARRQLAETARRFRLVARADAMMRGKGRHSMRAAALRLRTPLANLSRFLAAFRGGGVAALVPGIGTGRPSETNRLRMTAAEIAGIAALVRRGQIAPACKAFAKRPDCRPELARALVGRIPVSIRSAVRAVARSSAKHESA